MYMQSLDQTCLERFAPVSLAELNEKAAMLERLDNKYVVSCAILEQAFADLAGTFDILDIGGARAFGYDTCYYDDTNYSSYFDHHQGRRRRCKVRVRRYLGTDICFVEIKLKDLRGSTIKRRFSCDPAHYPQLDQGLQDQVAEAYESHYGVAFEQVLQPAIDVHYRRMTLVARQGGERMTVDGSLQFAADGRRHRVSSDLFVVETKSARGIGLADRVLRRLHQHPVIGCSKYCVGLAALGKVARHNRFLPAMRRLQILGGPDSVNV